ncbi:unnamed protein product, partial [Rangifer tarandus platyrhynchus]
MTPGEPGGGGGLVRLPCAEKPGTPPCAGLPRGPRLLGPCPSPAPGPGHPALQPGSAQVKGETQADGHSCPAAAGPAVGRRFTCCPVPVGPTGRTGRGTSPVLRPPTGVGGAGAAPCCPQGSPETTRPPVRDAGQDGASSAVRGFSVAPPSRPPPPTPSEHCAEPHLRPPSPRSASRPKAKSGLSRTQWRPGMPARSSLRRRTTSSSGCSWHPSSWPPARSSKVPKPRQRRRMPWAASWARGRVLSPTGTACSTMGPRRPWRRQGPGLGCCPLARCFTDLRRTETTSTTPGSP